MLAASSASLLALAAPRDTAFGLDLRNDALRARLPFVENRGQADPEVRFYTATAAGAISVSAEGVIVYRVPPPRIQHDAGPSQSAAVRTPQEHSPQASAVASGLRQFSSPAAPPTAPAPLRIAEWFAGGHAHPSPGSPGRARVSSFIGDDPSRHRTDLATFDDVRLGEVFPGIDVRLRATRASVEKIFDVRPGADPRAIALQVDGADALSVATTGELVVRTGSGDVRFTAPLAYQTVGGRTTSVAVRYVVDGAAHRYRFDVGDYDPHQPLTIDPMLQATYVGGGSTDAINAMVIDPLSGDVYVAGQTHSNNLPAGNSSAGSDDGFVARYSADLLQLKHVTYLGGSGSDGILAMTLHPVTGEILVAGTTFSPNFPCTTVASGCAAGVQQTYGGNGDGFVARLSPDLTQLRQATYYGTAGQEMFTAMAVSPLNGQVVVVGTQGQASVTFAIGVVLTATLTAMPNNFSFGGGGTSSFHILNAVAISPRSGDIVIAGYTNAALPCGINCFGGAITNPPGGNDGMVLRFRADGSGPIATTYFGGTGSDIISAVAIHPITGDVYIAGSTNSTFLSCDQCEAIAAQATYGGNQDGFVGWLSADLAAVHQATFIGGFGGEVVTALAIHPSTGDVYVAGHTASFDLPCVSPATGCDTALQSTFAQGTWDVLVARLSSDLQHFRQLTYYGGTGMDQAFALALHPLSSEVLVAGQTTSADLPCTSVARGCANGPQSAHAADSGDFDGFVARLSPDLTQFDRTPAPFAFAAKTGVAPLSIQTSGPAQITGLGAGAQISISGAIGATYCVSSTAGCSCDISGAFVSAPGTVTNNAYVCARHGAPGFANVDNFSVVQVGPVAARFYVSTGSPFGGGCSLDIDDNGAIDALTDGLMVLRAMFGLTGTSVTNNAVGAGAARATWAQIQPYLNGNCGTTFSP